MRITKRYNQECVRSAAAVSRRDQVQRDAQDAIQWAVDQEAVVAQVISKVFINTWWYTDN